MENLPLTVIENNDGSLTFEWDNEHPITSQLNTWTKDDFLNAIQMGVEELKMEKEEMKMRTEFTVEEFQRHFDELFDRVEDGETLTILHESGKNVMVTPLIDLSGLDL